MINKKVTAVSLLFVLTGIALFGCGKRKTPSRDQIPIIKEQFSKLQQGIYAKNPAVIDSLMNVSILKKGLTSDSLLKIVYGENDELAFKTFGQPEIVYTDNYARIESVMIDSTSQVGRPITFTFSNETGPWLLLDFKPGHESKQSQ